MNYNILFWFRTFCSLIDRLLRCLSFEKEKEWKKEEKKVNTKTVLLSNKYDIRIVHRIAISCVTLMTQFDRMCTGILNIGSRLNYDLNTIKYWLRIWWTVNIRFQVVDNRVTRYENSESWCKKLNFSPPHLQCMSVLIIVYKWMYYVLDTSTNELCCIMNVFGRKKKKNLIKEIVNEYTVCDWRANKNKQTNIHRFHLYYFSP